MQAAFLRVRLRRLGAEITRRSQIAVLYGARLFGIDGLQLPKAGPAGSHAWHLYVVQSVRGRGPFSDLCIGALPFVGAMIIMIGILIAFPEIALWLPSLLQPGK